MNNISPNRNNNGNSGGTCLFCGDESTDSED